MECVYEEMAENYYVELYKSTTDHNIYNNRENIFTV